MALERSKVPKDSAQGNWVYGSNQGIKYPVAANAAGVGVQSFLLAGGTGTSLAVDFVASGGSLMYDGAYSVFLSADGLFDISPDESTKTSTGFTILKDAGNFAAEVVNVIVVGRLSGQTA